MGRVILDQSMSLDGFVAGANISADNALGDGGDRLHEWMFSSGTETGRSIGRETFASAGAIVVGRRTFDLGKPHWDPDLTARARPVARPGTRAANPARGEAPIGKHGIERGALEAYNYVYAE
jgi:dihydrofolate reductase